MKTTNLAIYIALLTFGSAQAATLEFAKRPAKDSKAEAPKTAALLNDTSATASVQKPHTTKRWSYSGNTGPQNWPNLHRDYSACAGSNQSPINLTGFTEAALKPIEFNYEPETAALLNNGFSVQLNYRQPKFIRAEGLIFNLRQLNFHAPSENQINGKSYPMEAQFVHQNDRGELAMVAVMFEEGEANPALARSMGDLPMEEGHSIALNTPLSPDELLPANRDHYRFNGSLTTPPCTEGVRWFVLKEPVTASADQIKRVQSALGNANNRPIQDLNARMVLR